MSATQLPPDRARDPQSGRMNGRDRQQTTGGIMEAPSNCARLLEGTAGWLYWWIGDWTDQWEPFGPGCERARCRCCEQNIFRRKLHLAHVDEERSSMRSSRWARNIRGRADYRNSTGRPRGEAAILQDGDERGGRRQIRGHCARALQDRRPRRIRDPRTRAAGQRGGVKNSLSRIAGEGARATAREGEGLPVAESSPASTVLGTLSRGAEEVHIQDRDGDGARVARGQRSLRPGERSRRALVEQVGLSDVSACPVLGEGRQARR